ncbi:Transcription factor MYC2 [Glycine soja]|nr:hypothetical protein JHK87_048014 [Glycine soja]
MSSPDLSSLWLSTPQSATPGPDTSRAPPPPPPQSQSPLQRRLQTLLEGARESWTYAIFWESSHDNFSGATLLRWGDGYYQGEEEDKAKGKAPKTTSSAEQARRKKVLLELNSLISGPSVSADDVDEEVTDTVWFFLLSMTQSFANGTTLPGQAFFNSTPVWVAGPDRLSELACERARQGRMYGLRTLVCIPSANGVVELASTEVIFQNPDLMNKVLDLFNFNAVDGHPTLPPRQRKEKRLCERGMQNRESSLTEQSRGKEKISDLKCSWPLSESSDGGSDSTFSHSDDYSGPS